MLSKLLTDADLSLETGTKWLTTSPLPAWLVYARHCPHTELWALNARCYYGCIVLAYTVRESGPSRALYLLSDPEDGWHPCPPEDTTGHGGELIRLDSFKHQTIATMYTPAIKAAELAKWKARISPVADYWRRFERQNPQPTWPQLSGVILPPQPKGWLARMFG